MGVRSQFSDLSFVIPHTACFYRYVGNWRICKVTVDDPSIPAEVSATRTSLKMALTKFACPQHASKEEIETHNKRLLSALTVPSTH